MPARRYLFAPLTIIALLVGVAVLYVAVILAYRSGLAEPPPRPEPRPNEIVVVFSPYDVQTLDDRVAGTVSISIGEELTDQFNYPKNAIRVLVDPAIEGGRLDFPKNEPLVQKDVVLPADGTVQDYPLDRYDVNSFMTPYIVKDDGKLVRALANVQVYLNVPGWAAAPLPDVDSDSRGGAFGNDSASVQLHRSLSTVLLAIVLLALLMALGTVAILVTIAVARGRIKADFAPAAWLTAMLFAALPVRAFFPGSPPIGSWIDILIVFWVILLIMVSVTAVAGMLLTRAGKADRRDEPAGVRPAHESVDLDVPTVDV